MNREENKKQSGVKRANSRNDRLGQHLRQIYMDVANEPVPDDFLKLLEEADKSASSSDEDPS